MRNDDRVRILHMIDATESVEQFAAGRKRGDLDTDKMLLFAILRAIEVIGEAASKVTDETRAASPGVPWASIIGMRNRLIHGYFDIDSEVVWKTVTEEMPGASALAEVIGRKALGAGGAARESIGSFERQAFVFTLMNRASQAAGYPLDTQVAVSAMNQSSLYRRLADHVA